MEVDLNLSATLGEEKNSNVGSESEHREDEDLNPHLTEEVRALEQLLSVGSELDSIEAAYALFCDYARLVGFSVKKGTQSYFTNSLSIRMKAFYCSCEGLPEERRKERLVPKYRKCIARCNCKARLRIIRKNECALWKVSVFVKEHTHEMMPPDYTYLLRTARNLTLAQRSMLEVFHHSGIGVSKAVTFMENEARGVQNLGFIRRDAYTHMHRVNRKTLIEDGDADALLKFFREKNNSQPFFYWNYEKDEDGRLMNFFYRDTRSLEDYDQFGDVVLVDTTYRTNKYNLICAPFVGVNHHRSNVVFGIGFLSDETTSTFEWLFSSFLESMNGKEPGVIFSDQGSALVNGIENIFQTATHRLCQWHICQKTPLRFRKMKDDSAFKKLWYTCMNGCESVEEFEQHWMHMMEYEASIDAKWFRKMYQLRFKWSSVFSMRKFTAGIHATTRSECCNKVFKEICSASSTLISFVKRYEDLQQSWRQKEGEYDALTVWQPGQVLPNCRLMSFAANVYTRSIFKLFETQLSLSLCISIKKKPVDEDADELEYTVFSATAGKRERTIKVNLRNEDWSCSCMMWESEGIYCRHLLKILCWLNVYHIPEKHILDRWRKDARTRLYKPAPIHQPDASLENGDKILFVNRGIRVVHHLLQRCCEDPQKMRTMAARLKEMTTEFGGIFKEAEQQDAGAEEIAEGNNRSKVFRNPKKAKGIWVPGHRKNEKKGKKKVIPRKRQQVPVPSRFSQSQRNVVVDPSCESPRTSMLTSWRRDFNIPSSSQSVYVNFSSSCNSVEAFDSGNVQGERHSEATTSLR